MRDAMEDQGKYHTLKSAYEILKPLHAMRKKKKPQMQGDNMKRLPWSSQRLSRERKDGNY